MKPKPTTLYESDFLENYQKHMADVRFGEVLAYLIATLSQLSGLYFKLYLVNAYSTMRKYLKF